METHDICSQLAWDSNFFGVKIARVTTNRLTQDTASRVMEECASQAIDCVYFLADSNDSETVIQAEKFDFQLVDVRVTLEKRLVAKVQSPVIENSVGSPESIIRPALPSDIPFLKHIAKTSHGDSRFYYDPHFPANLCDAFYEKWIERSCRGYADSVWVAIWQGETVGYITCHRDEILQGHIGLISVASEAQGRKIGTKLVDAALHWFQSEGIERVTVVTQGRNISAQRLYQSCGFLVCSVQFWYHRWFNQSHS